MQITKKDKTNFDAITYCVKAKGNDTDEWSGMNLVYIEKNRVVGTDGHRLHIAWAKGIPDGIYEYSKTKQMITLKAVNHSYPDIGVALPSFKSVSLEVTADTKEFLHMAKMAKIMTTSDYSGTCLTFNGWLNIKVVNPDLGDMTGNVNISKTIDPEIKLGINLKYVIDALKGLGKQVTIGLQEEEGKPIIIRDKNRSALIMPMRI